MDLKTFGETLSRLMREAKLTRPALAERMNVSKALIDKWKSTSEDEKQQRRPAYEQVIDLVKIFALQLTSPEAQQWATQAGYQIPEANLIAIFPPTSLRSPPVPLMSGTYNRLEPLPPHQLFGVETAKTKLLRALNQTDDYWLLAIEGMGGIGKTSLANDLVREILKTQRFYDVVWISAKQEEFVPYRGTHRIDQPALEVTAFIDRVLEQLDPTLPLARSANEKSIILTHWLKIYPYLIVVDNLETISDYQALLPTLRHLANPTKFLLTSREQVEDIFSHTLRELDFSATVDFLRYMGKHQDLPAVVAAPESQLNEIYEVVGGNPLALKLIIGQLRSGLHSLSKILDNLKQARGKTVDQLYTFIYWQAWQDLDEKTRRLFVLMPQIPNATTDDLARKSKLSDEDLDQAIQQLTLRSLVEVRGDLDQPYYYLHSLTETFLLHKVIQWKSLT